MSADDIPITVSAEEAPDTTGLVVVIDSKVDLEDRGGPLAYGALGILLD